MFCWETRTTYLNIVADQTHPFMATVFSNGSKIMLPATLQKLFIANIAQIKVLKHWQIYKSIILYKNLRLLEAVHLNSSLLDT